MPAWNPLPTLPPRRYPLALLGATALPLGWGAWRWGGEGPSNDVKTAMAPVGRTTAASSLPAFWTTWRFRRSRGLTFARTKPQGTSISRRQLARIGKWHVACYEQLKHGRDVPRPALRR
jgi:hypothetical protein